MEIQTIKTIWSENELKQNTYVLIGETSCVIVDAGASITAVREITDKPIEAVFITHGHFDHSEFIEEYDALNVPIFASPKIIELMSSSVKNASSLFNLNMKFNVKNFNFVEDGDEIFALGVKVKSFATPGHTIDSMCFLFDDKYLFSGDTVFSIAVGRTDLATSDTRKLIDSLKKIEHIDYKFLYAGHGRKSDKQEQLINILRWIKELTKCEKL